MKINLSSFFESYGGRLIGDIASGSYGKFVVDSREANRGDIFVAIKGNNTDGHNFVSDVIEKGALGVIVERAMNINRGFQYIVESTNDFLAQLGSYARDNCKGVVIGITGSAGKTTTKEMIAHILSTKFTVSKAFANMNTDISLPLFLANDASCNSDFVILELGVQKPGDMDKLLKIAKPQKGVVLNIGESHLEYLRDKKGVLSEKFKLVLYIEQNGGTVFLNADDEMIRSYKKELLLRKVYFGLEEDADVKGIIGNITPDSMKMVIEASGEKIEETFPFSGYSLAIDILAAIAVVIDSGFSLEDAIISLKTFKPIKGRGNVINLKKGITIIDETYNSNPLSVVKSLEGFKDRKGSKLILILGDMLELGNNSQFQHKKIGQFVSLLMPDILITYGNFSTEIANVARENKLNNVFSFTEKAQITEFLNKLEIFENSIIFVKGSRGMKMEELVETIVKRFKNE
jgi:UDP-N-acetylmuramoyl-tripeptide--D-alanyl-D-alanine ligase